MGCNIAFEMKRFLFILAFNRMILVKICRIFIVFLLRLHLSVSDNSRNKLFHPFFTVFRVEFTWFYRKRKAEVTLSIHLRGYNFFKGRKKGSLKEKVPRERDTKPLEIFDRFNIPRIIHISHGKYDGFDISAAVLSLLKLRLNIRGITRCMRSAFQNSHRSFAISIISSGINSFQVPSSSPSLSNLFGSSCLLKNK